MRKEKVLKIAPRKADSNPDAQSNTPDQETERVFEIKAATLKESRCEYSYELCSGVASGDGLKRSGSALIHPDLQFAFDKLGPHLAVKCEEVDIEIVNDIADIEAFDPEKHKDESLEYQMSRFSVFGISITGSGERECVALVGEKRLSTNEYIPMKSPKIEFDGDYKYRRELKAAVDNIKSEVALYMGGKHAPKFEQAKIDFDENATV